MNKGLVELAWGAFALVIGFGIFSLFNTQAPDLTEKFFSKVQNLFGSIK